MRRPFFLLMLGLAGCARHSPEPWSPGTPAGTAPGKKSPAAIVTPAPANRGRIISVNATARHVVVTYLIGVPLPAMDQRLNVYRAGLKVGELKVSKERMDVNLVADITSGECRLGDEVRED